jgi:hypothetical protein
VAIKSDRSASASGIGEVMRPSIRAMAGHFGNRHHIASFIGMVNC